MASPGHGKSDDGSRDWRAFWSDLAGLPPDDLVFAPPVPAWRRHLRSLTSRWPWLDRQVAAMELPRHPVPRNIAPWTNAPLPDLRDDMPASRLARLHDRWLWIVSHPDTRQETLEWHRRQRRDSVLAWRVRKLRATLRGRAPGAPRWLRDDLDR